MPLCPRLMELTSGSIENSIASSSSSSNDDDDEDDDQFETIRFQELFASRFRLLDEPMCRKWVRIGQTTSRRGWWTCGWRDEPIKQSSGSRCLPAGGTSSNVAKPAMDNVKSQVTSTLPLSVAKLRGFGHKQRAASHLFLANQWSFIFEEAEPEERVRESQHASKR